MIQKQGIKEDWWILFTDSAKPTRFLKCLRPNYQHCYMMRKSPGGTYWVIVNPVRSHLALQFATVQEFPHPRAYDPSAVVLPVTVISDGVTPRGGMCFFNCVEVCKSVMGIKSFFTLTPWQLYRYIRSKS